MRVRKSNNDCDFRTLNIFMKIICEQRSDEGLRFFNDNVCGSIRAEKESGGDKRVIEMCEKNTVIYDDYNSHVKTDQSTIGTLTTNIGSSTRRNGTKLIESILGGATIWKIFV